MTKQLEAGPQLQLHTACQRFRMRIECGFQVISQFCSGRAYQLYSYFIKEGSVSEFGTHDELIAKRGDYYEYVQLQALNKKR